MPITARINLVEHFDLVDEAVERKSIEALNAAAVAGAAVFNQRTQLPGHEATVIPAHGTGTGYASGIKAKDPLWRIFDKGSLGKRSGELKGRDRRRPEWTVKQRSRTYTARRHEEALTSPDKGVAARQIANAARTAGRKALRIRLFGR